MRAFYNTPKRANYLDIDGHRFSFANFDQIEKSFTKNNSTVKTSSNWNARAVKNEQEMIHF
jgi:hypothetical protein